MSLASIIIVNYRTPDLTIRCIDSVYATTKTPFEIIVVDNASGDNSQEKIRTKFGDVVWIQNERNEGFGRANNIGVANAKGDYVLLLNSDMVVADGTIDHCIETIRSDAQIGALGCKLLNDDGSLQNSVYYDVVSYKSLLAQNILFVKLFKPNISKEKIVAVMGSFMLMPKELYNEVGGFDPDFFMYFEEVDLCRRLVEKGYYINYDSAVFAYHKHGASSSDNKKRVRQLYASQMLMVFKSKGFLGYVLYNTLFIINIGTNSVVSVFRKQYRTEAINVFRAFICNFMVNLLIPVMFGRKIGNGKRMLKIN